MDEFARAFTTATALVAGADLELIEIIGRSLLVSLSAVAIAIMLGMPSGAVLAIARFPGRKVLIVIVNALMGLPPVVVGLATYLVLSRAGPLGGLGLLFTPTAMVIAQAILITPILCALTRQVMEDLWTEYAEQLQSFDATLGAALLTLLWEGRFTLGTAVLAGLGRALAEVGAVLIVGGNIAHATRVMTTAIALETARGNLALALALGMILVALAIAINAAAYLIRDYAMRHGR